MKKIDSIDNYKLVMVVSRDKMEMKWIKVKDLPKDLKSLTLTTWYYDKRNDVYKENFDLFSKWVKVRYTGVGEIAMYSPSSIDKIMKPNGVSAFEVKGQEIRGNCYFYDDKKPTLTEKEVFSIFEHIKIRGGVDAYKNAIFTQQMNKARGLFLIYKDFGLYGEDIKDVSDFPVEKNGKKVKDIICITMSNGNSYHIDIDKKHRYSFYAVDKNGERTMLITPTNKEKLNLFKNEVQNQVRGEISKDFTKKIEVDKPDDDFGNIE